MKKSQFITVLTYHILLIVMTLLAAAVSSATAQAWSGWKYAPWTGDADSGVSTQNTYTVAHCFGNNHGTGVTVNGVPFTESFNTSGTGWSITGNKLNWEGDDNAVITGGSEDLAEEFIYGGSPRTVAVSKSFLKLRGLSRIRGSGVARFGDSTRSESWKHSNPYSFATLHP